MKLNNQREAFSMITAIVVMILMATVSVLVFSMSGKMIKETTTQYQAEQAALLANSYTEYAIMAVMGNNRSAGNCLQDIGGTIGNPSAGNGYSVSVNIAYIGNQNQVGSCAGTRRLFSDPGNNLETPLTIIVDAYVKYRDPDQPDQEMTFHRRTVQKI